MKTKPLANRSYCRGEICIERGRPTTSRHSKVKKTRKQTQAAFNRRKFGSSTVPKQTKRTLRRLERKFYNETIMADEACGRESQVSYESLHIYGTTLSSAEWKIFHDKRDEILMTMIRFEAEHGRQHTREEDADMRKQAWKGGKGTLPARAKVHYFWEIRSIVGGEVGQKRKLSEQYM
jgi:hypothetical protein